MYASPAVRPSLPILLAVVVFALGLVVAARVYHQYDVVDCFLAWARASGGLRPWDVYTPGAGADNCDYPPFVPYLLTLVEALRLAAGAPAVGALAILLLKLPSLVAHAAAVPLALRGLARPLGAPGARLSAILIALCPAFFVNGALWGQFDVLLTLFLMAAVVALLLDRPVSAGAAMGLALATKLLAIVPLPFLALWIWRRARSAEARAQRAGRPRRRVAVRSAPRPRRPWGRHAEGLHRSRELLPVTGPPRPTTRGTSSTATTCSREG